MLFHSIASTKQKTAQHAIFNKKNKKPPNFKPKSFELKRMNSTLFRLGIFKRLGFYQFVQNVKQKSDFALTKRQQDNKSFIWSTCIYKATVLTGSILNFCSPWIRSEERSKK